MSLNIFLNYTITYSNHGPVPKLAWDDHRITVTGLGVAEPQVLSMDELVALPNRTLPVTLVCAGNRRKEVNVTRQSKGFSWGSGAVSTSIWTGVPLHVLLRHCGVEPDALEPGQYWVNFDGPDGELPKGIYGTSIPLLKVSIRAYIYACLCSLSSSYDKTIHLFFFPGAGSSTGCACGLQAEPRAPPPRPRLPCPPHYSRYTIKHTHTHPYTHIHT